MEVIIAILVGLTVTLAVYQFRPLPATFFASSLEAAYAMDEKATLPPHRAALAAFHPLLRYTPAGWLTSIRLQLYWAKMAGKWKDWTTGEMVAAHMALAVAAAIPVLAFVGRAAPITYLLVVAAPMMFNMIYLSNPAKKARRQFQSELPEVIAIMAAEVASETSLQEAVMRVSRSSGMVGRWLRQAAARAAGRSLFSVETQTGALAEEAEASGEADLITLVRALDNIQRRGTGARDLLGRIAKDTAARYANSVMMRAEKVGGELIMPVIIFFFLPFVVSIMLIMAGPLAFGGGVF